MKKMVIPIIMAMVTSNAMAEWQKIYSDDTEIAYSDATTIKKNGNISRMSLMSEYPNPLKKLNDASSVVVLVEFDCRDEKFRSIRWNGYVGKFGKGNVLFSSDLDRPWAPPVPNTKISAGYKIACAK